MFDSLTIKNFGLHEATAIDFEAPVALFVGPNENGKSTIRQAARFLLDGFVVDEELLTVLQKQLYGHFVRNSGKAKNLTVAGAVKVLGKNYDLTRKQTAKASSGSPPLDLDRDALNCLFNSKYYARMKAPDRAKLWFRVLGLEMSMEHLKSVMKERVPSASVLDPADLGTIWLTYEKAGFDRAHNAAVELRREFKRNMEALPKDPPPSSTEIEFVKDGETEVKEIKFSDHTMEGTEAAIAHEVALVDDLLKERKALEGRQHMSAEHIRTTLADALKNIEQLEAVVKKLKDDSPELDVLVEKQKATAEAWREAHYECRDLELEIVSVEDLPDWQKHCPIYGTDVVCRSQSEIEKLLKDKRKAVGGLKRSRTAKLKKHDDLKGEIDRLTIEQNQLGENARLLLEKTQRLEYYREEARRLEKLKKDAKPFGKKEHDKLEQVGRDIRNVRGRINAFEILQDRLLKRENAVLAFEKTKDSESDLQGKINAADEIAVALGPGPEGIRASLTRDAREKVNEILARFNALLGRSVALDENLTVSLDDVPYEHLLSHSARRRLGIAIQAAIAALTGLNFFAVDDLENLDPVRRNDMLATAIGLAKGMKFQIWLLCSLGTKDASALSEALPIGGLEIFSVENGKVAKMGDPI